MFPDIKILEQLEAQVAPLYEGKDPGHDYSHIRDLFRSVVQLIEGESVDSEFLTLLCLFHGLWDDTRRPQTEAILRANGYTDDQIEQIYRSIFAVADGCPNRIEEALVHDANRLERLGAHGIARTLRIAGFRGQDLDTTLMHLHRNLETTKQMFTRRGQEIAAERRQIVKQYLKAWESETRSGTIEIP